MKKLMTFSAIVSQSAGNLLFSHIGEVYGYNISIIVGSLSIFLALLLIIPIQREL